MLFFTHISRCSSLKLYSDLNEEQRERFYCDILTMEEQCQTCRKYISATSLTLQS